MALSSSARLTRAINDIEIENAKTSIRTLYPFISSIYWDFDAENYNEVTNVSLTMADGQKVASLPDFNDMCSSELSYWLEADCLDESVLTDEFDVDFDLVGQKWFGIEGGKAALTAMFLSLSGLIEMASAANTGTVGIYLEPEAPSDLAATNAALAAIAALDALSEAPKAA